MGSRCFWFLVKSFVDSYFRFGCGGEKGRGWVGERGREREGEREGNRMREEEGER